MSTPSTLPLPARLAALRATAVELDQPHAVAALDAVAGIVAEDHADAERWRRYQSRDRTHFDGCWKAASHHACALAKLREAERERDVAKEYWKDAYAAATKAEDSLAAVGKLVHDGGNPIRGVERVTAELRTRRDAQDHGVGVWCWQGDGSDHPESLTCPVLMSAAQLRDILTDRDRAMANASDWRKLNEDKHRTIQAYCRAASEDKAEAKRLTEKLREAEYARDEAVTSAEGATELLKTAIEQGERRAERLDAISKMVGPDAVAGVTRLVEAARATVAACRTCGGNGRYMALRPEAERADGMSNLVDAPCHRCAMLRAALSAPVPHAAAPAPTVAPPAKACVLCGVKGRPGFRCADDRCPGIPARAG